MAHVSSRRVMSPAPGTERRKKARFLDGACYSREDFRFPTNGYSCLAVFFTLFMSKATFSVKRGWLRCGENFVGLLSASTSSHIDYHTVSYELE